MEYKCYSHPQKYLIEHLNNVREIGLSIFDAKKHLQLPIDRIDYRKALEIALYYHDFGKFTTYFQNYLQSYIKNQQCIYEKKLTRHSLLSAVMAAYKAYEQFKDKDIRVVCLIFSCILKHHGDFNNISDMLIIGKPNWEILSKQWNEIIQEDFNDSLPKFLEVKSVIDDTLYDARDSSWNIEWYYANNLMFSILTYADKNDVIFGKGKILNFESLIDKNVVYVYKNENFTINNDINKLRDEAFYLVEDNFLSNTNHFLFSINLPTGFGKTLSAINLALKMMENDDSLKRIIYALPFTSIVDQTADVVQQLYKTEANNIINIHHHLAKLELKVSEDYIDADKAQFVIENWDKPFIVTTFWQMFYALVSNENSILRKFHNIANSVIILDEIQTLPYKYWGLVNYILKKLAEVLNCKIIIMTATMPAIFKSNEVLNLINQNSRIKFFKAFNRYSIEKINNLEGINTDSLFEVAIKHILDYSDKDFMFVFNTIRSATKFFYKFKTLQKTDFDIFFLSSRVLPVDRTIVIKQIKKQNSKRKIFITTQLVEAGVDIDFDIVYRDFAPFDSIIQAAGRCNRNNKKPQGKVYVFRLKNELNAFDCEYIYKGLTLDKTFSILKKTEIIDESSLIEIIDKYYNEIKNNASTNESNALISNIEKLEYEMLKNSFSLVDEKPSYNVFIEKDENASSILAKFKEICKINDIFERRKKFLEIKSQFYQYVISISKLSYESNYFRQTSNEIDSFRIIEKDIAQMFYKEDVGFSVELDSRFF